MEQPNIGTRCDQAGCTVQCKRPSDLKRHLDTIHFRTNSYWCPVPTCNRSTTSIGNKPFTRKDKRAEHVLKVHKDCHVDLAAFDFGVESVPSLGLPSTTSTTYASGLTSYENQYTAAQPLQMVMGDETSNIFPRVFTHGSMIPLAMNLPSMELFPGQMGPSTGQRNSTAMSTAFSGTDGVPQPTFDTNVFPESIPAGYLGNYEHESFQLESQIGLAASFLGKYYGFPTYLNISNGDLVLDGGFQAGLYELNEESVFNNGQGDSVFGTGLFNDY